MIARRRPVLDARRDHRYGRGRPATWERHQDVTNSFGPFTLEHDGTALRRGAGTIPLGRRGLALLRVLLAHRGEAVAKDQLMAEVWPGLVVEDVNLSVQVAHLRKALGRTAEGDEWIVTVPRFGYRLTAGAEPETGHSPVPMLAVLPFQNLTPDGTWQYLADGLADELSSALSRFRGFGVYSRKARAQSAADYLIEGSLQIHDNDMRVVVTLISRDGKALWSNSFSGQLDAVFAFQDQVVRRVASIIEPRIQATELTRASRKPPASLAAYELYLQGVAKIYVYTGAANAEAISLLERALSVEPENASYLGFACWAYQLRYSQGYGELSGFDARRCIELADKAIERAGDDAAVLAHCGIALQLVAREYERGLSVAERGAALNPNDPVALGFAGLAQYLGGSLEVARERLHYCIALQPGDTFEAMGTLANVYNSLGRHEDALVWAGRGLAINPNYQPCLWVAIGSAYRLGLREDARKALEQLLSRHPGLTMAALLRVTPKDIGRIQVLIDDMLAAGMPVA